jgi:hypothetical protein
MLECALASDRSCNSTPPAAWCAAARSSTYTHHRNTHVSTLATVSCTCTQCIPGQQCSPWDRQTQRQRQEEKVVCNPRGEPPARAPGCREQLRIWAGAGCRGGHRLTAPRPSNRKGCQTQKPNCLTSPCLLTKDATLGVRTRILETPKRREDAWGKRRDTQITTKRNRTLT